jgi:hypothetical protein
MSTSRSCDRETRQTIDSAWSARIWQFLAHIEPFAHAVTYQAEIRRQEGVKAVSRQPITVTAAYRTATGREKKFVLGEY